MRATALIDFVALAAMVAVFSVAVLALPVRKKVRLLLAAGVAPFFTAALVVFALVLTGVDLGFWL